MIENITQMRKRHEAEIAKLQKLCKHKETERMPFMWALGHFGNDVEVCEWCGKIVKTYEDKTEVSKLFGEPSPLRQGGRSA